MLICEKSIKMNNIQPIWLKYGILYGIVAIAISLLSYYTTFLNTWIQGVIGFAIMVFFMMMAGKEERDAQGGYIKYIDAFKVTSMAAFIGTVISVLFSIIMINLIDPDLADKLTQVAIEQTRATMEKLGTPSDAMEDAIESMEENMADSFTPVKQLLALLMSSVFIAIIAALVSLFIKRENQNPFEDDAEIVLNN